MLEDEADRGPCLESPETREILARSAEGIGGLSLKWKEPRVIGPAGT
jgi:hypothetical protein